MASIRKEIVIAAPPELVWEALRDVGAVHTRLLPDRVMDTHLEGDARILTFNNGGQVRELIVDVDEETRRLAYAVVGGARMRMMHHHASFQVFARNATLLPAASSGLQMCCLTRSAPRSGHESRSVPRR